MPPRKANEVLNGQPTQFIANRTIGESARIRETSNFKIQSSRKLQTSSIKQQDVWRTEARKWDCLEKTYGESGSFGERLTRVTPKFRATAGLVCKTPWGS